MFGHPYVCFALKTHFPDNSLDATNSFNFGKECEGSASNTIEILWKLPHWIVKVVVFFLCFVLCRVINLIEFIVAKKMRESIREWVKANESKWKRGRERIRWRWRWRRNYWVLFCWKRIICLLSIGLKFDSLGQFAWQRCDKNQNKMSINCIKLPDSSATKPKCFYLHTTSPLIASKRRDRECLLQIVFKWCCLFDIQFWVVSCAKHAMLLWTVIVSVAANVPYEKENALISNTTD